MKRVEVEWLDSVTAMAGWEPAERAFAEQITHNIAGMPVRSIGWLFMDEKEYIVIVLNEGQHPYPTQVSEGIKIPRVAIRNIWELRRK